MRAGRAEFSARVALVVASLIVATAMAEIFLMLASGRGSAPNLHIPAGYGNNFVYSYEPHTRGTTYDTWAEFNNQGMRRKADIADTPSPGVTRILSYGDSISFGFKLEESETYASRLESLLSASGKTRFEALNMARGHTPSVHLVHMNADIPRLHPKMVILEIELTNDISDEVFAHFNGRRANGLPNEIVNARYIVSWNRQSLHTGFPMLGPHFKTTYLYTLLNRTAMAIRSQMHKDVVVQLNTNGYFFHRTFDASFLTRSALDSAFEQMFSSIQAAHSLAKQHGVEFLVLLVPSKYLLYQNSHFEVTKAVTDRAQARLELDGIPYLSLYSALVSTGLSADDLYFDFCHPKAVAQEIIAKSIADRIAKGTRLLQ